MRWLTVAVAGSFCPGWVWLVALLLFTGQLGQAQTVEVAAPGSATDHKATVTIVTQRTERRLAADAMKKPALAVAQVTVVTEKTAEQAEHRQDSNATTEPLPPTEFNPDPGA